MNMTPNEAQNAYTNRRSAIDRRTAWLAGYAVSQRRRKVVEELFGCHDSGRTAQDEVSQTVRRRAFTLAAAAYKLVWVRNLLVSQVFPRKSGEKRARTPRITKTPLIAALTPAGCRLHSFCTVWLQNMPRSSIFHHPEARVERRRWHRPVA
jgi:hypothetical protein